MSKSSLPLLLCLYTSRADFFFKNQKFLTHWELYSILESSVITLFLLTSLTHFVADNYCAPAVCQVLF